MSRETLFSASRTNLTETGLTAWYGLIGASLSVGAPLIGTMSPPLALVSAAIPLFSRWNQISEISSEHQNIEQQRSHYYARAAVKAIVNISIFAATYSIGFAVGQTACFLFLVSFCVSKFINLGNASPIEHLEDLFSTNQKDYPTNRQNIFSSLSANVTDTLRASFYGLVAIATQFPLPYVGQLTTTTATMFFTVPLTARISQINQIDMDPAQTRSYRAKALVSSVMDILVGLGLFAAATLFQLDKIAIFCVLAGWAAAKLTSGGEKSPIHHIQSFFDRVSGAQDNTALIPQAVARPSAPAFQ